MNLVDHFSRLSNLGCEDCGKCKLRLSPPRSAHLAKRVLDIIGAHEPVLSVLRRCMEFDMTESFTSQQRSRRGFKKMSVACTSIMNL